MRAFSITPANGTLVAFPELPEANGELVYPLQAPPLDQLQASLQQSQRLSLENVWACTVRILRDCELYVQLLHVSDVQGRAVSMLEGTHWPTFKAQPGGLYVFRFRVNGPGRFCAGCAFSPEILEPLNG